MTETKSDRLVQESVHSATHMVEFNNETIESIDVLPVQYTNSQISLPLPLLSIKKSIAAHTSKQNPITI
jgi:hypothetical protein